MQLSSERQETVSVSIGVFLSMVQELDFTIMIVEKELF